MSLNVFFKGIPQIKSMIYDDDDDDDDEEGVSMSCSMLIWVCVSVYLGGPHP